MVKKSENSSEGNLDKSLQISRRMIGGSPVTDRGYGGGQTGLDLIGAKKISSPNILAKGK